MKLGRKVMTLLFTHLIREAENPVASGPAREMSVGTWQGCRRQGQREPSCTWSARKGSFQEKIREALPPAAMRATGAAREPVRSCPRRLVAGTRTHTWPRRQEDAVAAMCCVHMRVQMRGHSCPSASGLSGEVNRPTVRCTRGNRTLEKNKAGRRTSWFHSFT